MRRLAFLALIAMSLAGAGPVVGQTPALDQALRRAGAAAPLPLSLAREQADWLREHAGVPAGPDSAADTLARIQALTAQADRDERMGRMFFRNGIPARGRDCVATALRGCQSSMGGYLAVNGAALQWQLQEGYTEEAGVSGGIVFIGEVPAARLGPSQPIAWSFDAARFDAPVLLTGQGSDSETYIAVPGVHAGSGSANADVLLRWTPGGARELTEIDTWSWRDGLNDQLPEGLEIWKGVRFDWPNMVAFSPLWQDGDANCCASGGTAVLSFEIEGDRLVLGNVSVRDSIVDSAASTPASVFDYVVRSTGCAHWGGEEGYDTERTAQITAAVTELRCASLHADGVALRGEYADSPRILALISRAGVY